MSRRWMKRTIGLILIIIVIALGFWLMPKSEETGVIKIGFIAPLSGDAAIVGEEEANAVKLALEEINNAGGVNGKKLEVIYEDGKCDGKEAATAAQKLINVDNVKIILGGSCSAETLGAAPITESNKVILLSAFSSSPNIETAGDYVFRTVFSDTHPSVIESLIPYMKEYNNIAIITENSDYSMGIRKGLKEQLPSYNVEIVADELFSPGEKDFKTYLIKIKAKNPEALYVNAGTSADTPGLIVKQTTELGMKVKFFGNYLLVGSEAIKIAGNLLEGAIAYDAPLLDPSNSKAAEFMEKYNARYGEPYSFWDAGARYDTVYLTKNAIEKCGEDTSCIKDYFYKMDWTYGTIGKYKFDENGDVMGLKLVVKKIVNGKVEVIG